VEGLGFGETFAHVAHLEAIMICLAFAVSKRLKPLDASHFAALWGGGGTWCLSSLWLGLRESLFFILYILYLVFIALHFICYTSLYLVDYARVSRNEM
jgi:hypothetical protein